MKSTTPPRRSLSRRCSSSRPVAVGGSIRNMSEQGGATPAGWYADPQVPGQHRWWDGRTWGPTAPPVPPARIRNDFGQVSLTAGIIGVVIALVSLPLALIFAVVGVGLGIRGVVRSHRTGAARGTWIAGFVLNGLVILYPVMFGFP